VTQEETQREAEHRANQDRAFNRFLSDPMTRMGMSMIPPGEHPDALKLLLRSAFDAGAGAGVSSMMIGLMGAMIKRRDEK
jgi:hypothetical protein